MYKNILCSYDQTQTQFFWKIIGKLEKILKHPIINRLFMWLKQYQIW